MVPGLVLVLVSGLIGFSTYTNPAFVDLAAIAFGAGAALVLDEFALVFHLEDVYWEDEGRQSVVATVLGAAVIVLMLVVTAPSGLHSDTFSDRSRIVALAYLGGNALFALICFLKGKPFVGLTAIFVPFVGLVGAIAARSCAVALGPRLLRRGEARARPRVGSRAASGSGSATGSSPCSAVSRTAPRLIPEWTPPAVSDRHEHAEHDTEQRGGGTSPGRTRGRIATSAAARVHRGPGGSGR